MLTMNLQSADENKNPICRLCLKTSDDVTNIWETFQGSTIASILVKHFWFEINKDDGLTELLCQRCWLQTKAFHEFYRKIEQLQKCLLKSTSSVEEDIDEEATSDAAFESDLNVIKCEETELRSEAIDLERIIHDSSDDENIIDECESEKFSEKHDQCSNDEEEDGDSVIRKGGLSSSEKVELEGQIRELFNMKCEICKEVEFETLSKAKKHYRQVHDTQGYIMCCGKKFTLRYDILRHIRYHINPETNQLDCEIRELFTMKCDICGSGVDFETLSEVQKHFRKMHKVQSYIRCSYPLCSGRKFRRRYEIVRHIRYHKDPDAYSCDQCNRKFKDCDALKNHIANHVPLDSRNFKCTLCKSSFAKACLLKIHVEYKHTSKTGEKFPCEKCGKNFRSNHLLSCHTRQSHELAQDYVCEVCARIFKSKYTIKQHIKKEHSTTPPPKVQCDICGAWLRRLQKHRKLHEEFTSVKCPICNKEVRHKFALRNHVAYAHSEKRYSCTFCEKSFKRAGNLKEHIAIHTGEDLYDCPYCEKKFKSNANMYSHRKKAHLAEYTRDYPQRCSSKNLSATVEIEGKPTV